MCLLHRLKSFFRHLPSLLNGLVLFLLTTTVFAQPPTNTVTGLSAETMLVNIATQVPDLMRLITAFAYVMGMYFIVHGVIKLKHAGESRTMMSYEHSLMSPIMYIAVGTLLLYLPTTVQLGLSTFWTQPNPYGYLEQQDQWSEFINVIYIIIQLIGTIAFIRGLIMLSHLGGQGGREAGLAKSLTYMIGGILCINIYQFVQVIFNTLGISIT